MGAISNASGEGLRTWFVALVATGLVALLALGAFVWITAEPPEAAEMRVLARTAAEAGAAEADEESAVEAVQAALDAAGWERYCMGLLSGTAWTNESVTVDVDCVLSRGVAIPFRSDVATASWTAPRLAERDPD